MFKRGYRAAAAPAQAHLRQHCQDTRSLFFDVGSVGCADEDLNLASSLSLKERRVCRGSRDSTLPIRRSEEGKSYESTNLNILRATVSAVKQKGSQCSP